MPQSKFFRINRNADVGTHGTTGGGPTTTTQPNGGDLSTTPNAPAPTGTLSITHDKLNEYISNARREATEAARSGFLNTLKSDEKARNEFLATLGISTSKGGDTKVDEAVRQASQHLEQTKLLPLQQQLEQKDKLLSSVLDKTLEAQLVNAAREAGFKPGFAKVTVASDKAKFAYNETTGDFRVKQGDGWVYGANGPMTPSEYYTQATKNPDFKDFLDVRPQGAPGASPAGTPQGTITIKASDAAAWTKYRKEIEEGKVKVEY